MTTPPPPPLQPALDPLLTHDPHLPRAQRDALLAALPNEKLRAEIGRLRPDGPYVWSWLFPKVAGFGAGGDIKRRVNMLASIEPRLDTLLFPDERIEFVTTGALNSFVEQFFMGVWSVIVNRTLFVFTNLRLILLNSDQKGTAKTLMWQIPYDRMQKYGAGTLGGVVSIKTRDGRSYTFIHVPGADRKRLKDFMLARLEQTQMQGLPFPAHLDRDPLCAQCASPVPPKALACPECGDQFINPVVPALLSLLMPGLGHLYLGHRLMALIEMAGFAIILTNMTLLAISSGIVGLLIAILVVALTNGIDSLVTLHVAHKGCLPKRLAWKAP